ncbi:hypothetical protein PAECIP111894_04162 [Paenibacillus pseudetheri]|uniref:Uncharacterized protein n=1 Tax=Paenibacillus pseudetheri TaxID=2897682 RepID=A0ABM9BGK8_9BACL|nr:hypothetical protein PAECIP111894_04162 [Paenibacillus pseudetheri]
MFVLTTAFGLIFYSLKFIESSKQKETTAQKQITKNSIK